jgi:predicted patatin/cPLA2 family phospholipase
VAEGPEAVDAAHEQLRQRKKRGERSKLTGMREEIKYLVLQGGGIRCAWQAGFIAAFERKKPIRPNAISAVSASSTVACALVCRRLEFGVDCLKAAIAKKRRETFVGRVIRGQRIFPHADIYRNAVMRTFDQSSMETLFAGPDIQVLVTRTCANLPKYAGTVTGLTLYALQTFGMRRGYRRMEAQFGFCKEFVAVKKCATPADLADLVLASSCTPPFTPFYSLHGRPVLDGGLSESVPLSGLPEGRGTTLVLLTAKGATANRIPGIVYAEPSQDLRINGWDYDAKKIDYLYDLGKKDGDTFFETEVM